jgi:hypothetical protein
VRWAFSPLGCAAHLLLIKGDYPFSVLKARCGELLPMVATALACASRTRMVA